MSPYILDHTRACRIDSLSREKRGNRNGKIVAISVIELLN